MHIAHHLLALTSGFHPCGHPLSQTSCDISTLSRLAQMLQRMAKDDEVRIAGVDAALLHLMALWT
jgi:hypothetical protein